MTLQRKIVFIILAGLGIGLGAFSWVGIQSVQKSVERTLDERLTMARVLASHLDGTLSYIVNDVQDTSFNNELDTRTKFASAAVKLRDSLAKSRIIVRRIILVAPDGTITDIEPGDTTSIGQSLAYPALPQTLIKGRPAISGLEIGLVTDTPVFFASAPVFDRQGKIAGAFIAAIDVKSDNDAFSPSVTAGKTGYVEIIDGSGLILTRTARASPPGILEKSDHPERFAALITQQKATVGTCHRCHETSAQIERQRDILAFAPLSTASWGVAIRQSEDEALAPTRELEQRFLLLGIIIVISLGFLVWLMMREVVTPIRSLTAAAKRIAAGDFKAGIAVKSKDEIGQLGTAFHTMTRELAKSRGELLSRNEELFALNSIVATVSESLDLDEVLGTALSKVLEVTKTTAGHVFLRQPDNGLKTKKDIGASAIFQCPQAADPNADCTCRQVLRTGQTMLANDSSQCPQLADLTAFFVCIPLKSKSRTLGIMNIAGTGERVFTSVDFRLLDSIGYHVGLAIENAMLYEETRQEEELRGKLLGSVIGAQEEERKRVSRELHDEYGQVMTGLIMSMESLENTTQEQNVKEKLGHAKSLAERALDNLRRLTLDLRPSVLDDLGLVAAVRAFARNRLESSGIQVAFEARGLKQRLAAPIETALFRILQEAIHNIGKHAGAHTVKIILEAGNGCITATVEDDGKGFDLEAVSKSKIGTQSLGLLGIKERATLLGGTLNISSTVGRGTRLTVEIPLSGGAAGMADLKEG